jgi:hypothetical protein
MGAVGHIVNDFVLNVDGKAYECATTGLDSSFDQDSTTIRTACPDGTKVVYGNPAEVLSWNLNVDHAADSAYTFVRENIGKRAAIHYESADHKAVYDGFVIIGAPSASAQVGSVETATVSLAVDGKLTRQDAPAPAVVVAPVTTPAPDASAAAV